jgi:hypothetical protein
MSKGSLGYGPASNAGTSRSKRYRHRTFIMLGVSLATAFAIYICWFHIAEAHFQASTDPSRVYGKTVQQIVASLGRPDEDHRDRDHSATQPLWLVHSYGPNENFNGSFVYLDGWGSYFCRIEIQHGVATKVEHLKDMR